MYKKKEDIQEEYNIQTGENLINVDVQNRPHKKLAENAEIIYEGINNITDQAGIEYSSERDIYRNLPNYLSHNYLEDGMTIKKAIRILDRTLYNIFTMTVTASPSGDNIEKEDDGELQLGYGLSLYISEDPIFSDFSTSLYINPFAIDLYVDLLDLSKFRIVCGFDGRNSGYSMSYIREIECKNNGESFSEKTIDDVYLKGENHPDNPLKYYLKGLVADSWFWGQQTDPIYMATIRGLSNESSPDPYKYYSIAYEPDEDGYHDGLSPNEDGANEEDLDYTPIGYLKTSENDVFLYVDNINLPSTEIYRKLSSEFTLSNRMKDRSHSKENADFLSFMYQEDKNIFLCIHENNHQNYFKRYRSSYADESWIDIGDDWVEVEDIYLPIQYDFITDSFPKRHYVGTPTTLTLESGDVLIVYFARVEGVYCICAGLGKTINGEFTWYKTGKKQVYLPHTLDFHASGYMPRKIPLIQTPNNGSIMGFFALEPTTTVGGDSISEIYKVSIVLE